MFWRKPIVPNLLIILILICRMNNTLGFIMLLSKDAAGQLVNKQMLRLMPLTKMTKQELQELSKVSSKTFYIRKYVYFILTESFVHYVCTLIPCLTDYVGVICFLRSTLLKTHHWKLLCTQRTLDYLNFQVVSV